MMDKNHLQFYLIETIGNINITNNSNLSHMISYTSLIQSIFSLFNYLRAFLHRITQATLNFGVVIYQGVTTDGNIGPLM